MTKSVKFEPILLLDDEPVRSFKVDELSLVPFAKVIAGVAAGTGGPFTIGVFGDWGEGKTSLLRQAKTLLEAQRPEVVTAWFNAWQYEQEDHPIVPLVATILRQIDQKLAERDKKNLGKPIVEALTKIGRSLRAIAYGFSAKAKVAVPGFGEIEAGFVAKEMIDRYEKLQGAGDPLIERTLYYNAFETLEAATSGPSKDRPKIVVFIDDLDRCLPPQAVKLLESIKLVLAQQGFIFVLAVDRRIVESYLVKRYRDDYGVADYEGSGKSYLDKIVQLPLPLPPHRSRFEQYIGELLKRPTFQGANQPVREAIEELVGVLAVGSNYNPRSLVRFINNLIVDRNIWIALQQQQEEIDLGLCAVSRILRAHLGDPFHNVLVESDDLCEKLAGKTPSSQNISSFAALKVGGELSPAEDQTRRIERRIEELPFLKELLRTHAGKRWLTQPDQRRSVNEFLVAQREETEEDPRSSREIIDQEIRRILNKPKGAIAEEDRQSITSLDLGGTQVSDLSPLADLSNLQKLDLASTRVSDLSPLAGLTKLNTLIVASTQVNDLSALAGLSILQTLELDNLELGDLTPLANLSNLRRLDLSGAQVADLSPLPG